MTILNLTQHAASQPQVEAGVVEVANKEELKALLTFVGMPSAEEVSDRAKKIAALAAESNSAAAMIGGALYLMAPLEKELKARGIKPLYAFSERRSVETTSPTTGEVEKKAIFVHLGFVESS